MISVVSDPAQAQAKNNEPMHVATEINEHNWPELFHWLQVMVQYMVKLF